MIREIILFIVMVYIIISLIEMISKLFWIMQYYHIGINIYNRKIPKRNEQLCQLFARVKEEINNNELFRISFHISDKKDRYYFAEHLSIARFESIPYCTEELMRKQIIIE